RMNEAKTVRNSLGRIFAVPRMASRAGQQEAARTEYYTIDPSDSETVARLVDESPRQMFCPSVDFLLLSSIWIARVGVILDSAQSAFSYGNRLRASLANSPGPSFRPYIANYVKWRDSALETAARAAKDAQHVEILTFDLRNFYGSVNPNFLRAE